MNYIIKNGKVIDPANNINKIADILIRDGKIEKVQEDIASKDAHVIDAEGRIVTAGLVDMHAHLREPGREDKETILTGTRAAIRGGFTTVCCMPNTEPPLDNSDIIDVLLGIIKKDAYCNVFIIGAITKGRNGEELTNFTKLKEKGVVALSDDGSWVRDESVLEKALKESQKEKLLIIEHCEDEKLSGKGVINRGFIATKTGLKGIPKESEFEAVKRDLEIAEKTSSKIHIAHVSCKESVELIRDAKKRGVKVTAETAPHYLALTEEDCACYNTNTKVNPPLRTKEDQKALKDGLKDGTIDVIATDHAPHTDSEKDVEFDRAPFGMTGLETALPICLEELVDKNILTLEELFRKMSLNPSSILGIGRGTLSVGAPADIIVIDTEKTWTYQKNITESKAINSPFLGRKLKGIVTDVVINGKPLWRLAK